MSIFNFLFTGPASIPEQYEIELGPVHFGYSWRDFGAVPSTASPTYDVNVPWQVRGEYMTWWGKSTGPTVMGPPIATHSETTAGPVTFTLDSGAVAGDYLLIVFCALAFGFGPPFPDNWGATITDSAGAGLLRHGPAFVPVDGPFKVELPSGIVGYIAPFAYELVGGIAGGDTITVDIPQMTMIEVGITTHVITGLAAGNPQGPDVGGNYPILATGWPVGFPETWPVPPVPKWVGPSLFWAGGTPSGSHPPINIHRTAYELSLARGVATIGADNPLAGGRRLIQEALPELVLVHGCTLELEVVHTDGSPRTVDLFSDLRLTFEDFATYEPLNE